MTPEELDEYSTKDMVEKMGITWEKFDACLKELQATDYIKLTTVLV